MGFMDTLKDTAREAVDAPPRPYGGQKWEYRVRSLGESTSKGVMGGGTMESVLNQMGAQGWELAAVVNDRMVFKRHAA